jgi:hypothetical protein
MDLKGSQRIGNKSRKVVIITGGGGRHGARRRLMKWISGFFL